MIDTAQQQKAQYAAQTPANPAYADQNYAQTTGYSPAPEPLAAQLGRRLARDTEELNNLYRAQDILMRHPEYEELLWLLRSGIV